MQHKRLLFHCVSVCVCECVWQCCHAYSEAEVRHSFIIGASSGAMSVGSQRHTHTPRWQPPVLRGLPLTTHWNHYWWLMACDGHSTVEVKRRVEPGHGYPKKLFNGNWTCPSSLTTLHCRGAFSSLNHYCSCALHERGVHKWICLATRGNTLCKSLSTDSSVSLTLHL